MSQQEQLISSYQNYLESTLKNELETLVEKRENVYETLSKYLQLRNSIEMIQDQKLEEMKTMVNIGSDIFAQAKVPNTSRIYLKIGLGFHVDMTLNEALDFINKKEEYLNQEAKNLDTKINETKSEIKSVYMIIDDIIENSQ
eukprot:gb/GECH01002644.1/.p1 GENE.gb/GECH01002644.1/~~gb/GECH01002644.1/.p1  ORF type:complete len:142 (+),score=48.98 gb/GECH01002644.1/:1-426(+)